MMKKCEMGTGDEQLAVSTIPHNNQIDTELIVSSFIIIF